MIDDALGREPERSLSVSALSAENKGLMSALEASLEALEDRHAEGDDGAGRAREEAYGFLREMSVRGWSFFDVSSFRERMVKVRAEAGP
jgi:hypothetical protein